jgi:4-amino-4-deoxy-L-arabinose transferase-like glycosyltransferase
VSDRRIATAFFIASALLRVPFRGDAIFHGDSYGLAAGVLYTLTAHPPGFIGYCALVRAAYWLVGNVSLAFVVVNILSTGIATALTFLLGRKMFGRAEGVIAAVLFATSIDVSYFAEVALTYAAEGAFATAAGLTGWMSVNKRSFRWLLVHSAVLAIGGSVRQTTLAFLFPLWIFVLFRSVPRWWQRAVAVGVLALVVMSWSVPNAKRLAKYWDKRDMSYFESVYKLQVAMEQYYDPTSFGKVSYEPKVARFHWPLVELGVAAWNTIHPPAPEAPIEVRTASASNATRMIRYQVAKLLLYAALAMGLATIFVLLAFLPKVRGTFGAERTIFLLLWILPAALFFALNHLGAWGYLLIFLAAVTCIAARSITILFTTARGRTIVVALIALMDFGAFLVMRPLPETSDRNRTIDVALLQYGAAAIRMHYARSRARAYTSDPRQLAVDCVTDDCLRRDLPHAFHLPPDLQPAEPLFRVERWHHFD